MSPQAPVDHAAEFAAASEAAARHDQQFVLRLFVTGSTLNSARAIRAIRTLCEEFLSGRYELEIIDIYQQPRAARDEQIVAAPTLIKKSPAPLRKIIGDLSDFDRVLTSLGVNPRPRQANDVSHAEAHNNRD